MEDDIENSIEAIEEMKYLYCWGFGKYGQIGKKFINYSITPINIEIDIEEKEKDEVFGLYGGESHCAILTYSSKLYTFGKNIFGQLGLSHSNYVYMPTLVSMPDNIKILKVACGGDHTLALSDQCVLFGWGLNVFGQLGLGDFVSRNAPCKIELYMENILSKSEQIEDMCTGSQHSMILTNKGRLFTCGFSKNYSLGYDTVDDVNIFHCVEAVQCQNSIDRISCGVYHSACIMDTDVIMIWGEGEILKFRKPTALGLQGSVDSQLSGSGIGNQISPRKRNYWMIKDIKIGEDFVVALNKNDEVFTMGNNTYGQLGNGTTQPRANLLRVDIAKIKQIEVGYQFVIGVTVEGKVFGWGSNEFGQLGLTTKTMVLEPMLLDHISELGFIKMACGGYNCIGLFSKLTEEDMKKLDDAPHVNVMNIMDNSLPSFNIEAIKNSLKQFYINSTTKKDFALMNDRLKLCEALKKKIAELEQAAINKEVTIRDLSLKEEELSRKTNTKKPGGKYAQLTRGFDNTFEISIEEIEFTGGDDEIGKGTFGDVKRGVWRKEVVAVKFLKPEMINSEDNISAFIEECTILKNLRHPNILLFMGASTTLPYFFIVTEYCENGNLFELLHQHKNIKLSWEDLRRIALEIAYGINYLHSFDPPILHRDLKSMNVLLDRNFQVKIADFGSTKFLDVQMTKQKGTFQWMAPEVIKGSNYTEKADIFSFGIILNELATRQPPYYGVDKKEVAKRVANHPEYRPALMKHMPKDWAELMTKCWDHNPNKRPTFNEIIDSLNKMKLGKT